MFRTADSFGISKLILSGYTPVPPRPEISKTALGADEFVDWVAFKTIDEVFKTIVNPNYRLVGLEQTTSSVPIQELTVDHRPVCLVVGNEITGIDDQLLPFLEIEIEIPQYGRKHSLNVSVAAGIALFHLHELYREK
jgi:23S rRNA (guanosine2251-2'-O)-methyltransferase